MRKVTIGFFSLLIFTLTTLQASAQSKLTVYKNHKFSIEYPAHWKMEVEDETAFACFPKENYGTLSAEYEPDNDIPLSKTKELILMAYEIDDVPENVKMKKKGNFTEFYYESIVKDVKWVIKAFRRNTDLYIVSVKCNLNKWDTNKEVFMNALNSFKPN